MNFFDALVLWIHILAAAVFIGPQIFLVLVAIPALRTVADAGVRRDITRKITRGFGVVGGIALAVLLATGIWNYFEAKDEGLLDFKRYFIAMQLKLTLVTIVIILTIVHGAVLGRKLQALQESGASEAELAQTRQLSMYSSMANLAASIAILLCAAILGSQWSLLGGLR